MKKKKMGRPRKDETEKKKNRVALSLTDSQIEGLDLFSQETGIEDKAVAARLLYLEGLKAFLARRKKPGPGGKAG